MPILERIRPAKESEYTDFLQHRNPALQRLTTGILIGEGSLVTDCAVRENGTEGILASAGSAVTNCVAARNGTDGINVSQGCSVSGSTARSNSGHGIVAAGMGSIIRENVAGVTHILTDKHASYRGLEREFAGHGTVNHSAGEYVRGIVHTNFSESYYSLMKRAIVGSLHHVSVKHLPPLWRNSTIAGTVAK